MSRLLLTGFLACMLALPAWGADPAGSPAGDPAADPAGLPPGATGSSLPSSAPSSPPARVPGAAPTAPHRPAVAPARESLPAPVSRPAASPRLLSSQPLVQPLKVGKRERVIWDEWLVNSVSIEAANRERKQLEALGLKIRRRQQLSRLGMVITVYRLPAGGDAEALYRKVQSLYPQLQVEFNQRYVPQGLDPVKQYGQRLAGVGEQGCPAFTGQIAMLDAAVNAALPQFQSGFGQVDVTGAKETIPGDHGTAVASVLKTLLPNAKLLAINVYQGEGSAAETHTDWLLSGFETVLGLEARPVALNMSFGGNDSRFMKHAVKQLAGQGIRLVAAAGNDGPSAAPVYPAAYEQVSAVTAVDANERVWAGANQGEYIDFAAPGVDLWLPDASGTGRFVSGTSFAAPWVTVAAALASDAQWQKPALIGRDLGKPGRDSLYGYGLLNLAPLCR